MGFSFTDLVTRIRDRVETLGGPKRPKGFDPNSTHTNAIFGDLDRSVKEAPQYDGSSGPSALPAIAPRAAEAGYSRIEAPVVEPKHDAITIPNTSTPMPIRRRSAAPDPPTSPGDESPITAPVSERVSRAGAGSAPADKGWGNLTFGDD